MTPEQESKFNEMYAFFQEIKAQQIREPLDTSSQDLIRTHLPVFNRWIASVITPNGRLEVFIDGVRFEIPAKALLPNVTPDTVLPSFG
jgi:hypothetical protein